MIQSRLLIVEDDADIVHVVKAYLETEGFKVEVARDGLMGFEKAVTNPPALIVLDWMLPGIDGITFMHRLRKEQTTPIIMLTARTGEEDRLKGLSLADDYITKPFSPKELVARVKAVLRRDQRREAYDLIRHGPLTLDPKCREVQLNEIPIDLTTLEFELLYTLASSPERVFRRDELLERVWGSDFVGGERVVDVHILHLRQKLEPVPDQPRFLLTVRGVGYKLLALGGNL
jgi:DNA-binding response OmpR family regulator